MIERFRYVPRIVEAAVNLDRRLVAMLEERDRKLEDYLAKLAGTVPGPATSVVSETSFGQGATVGSDLLFARSGHSHGTPPAPPPSASPSSTVVAEQTFGQASGAGAAGVYSRGDHTHGTPAAPPASPLPSGSVTSEMSFGQGASAGVAAGYSRGDHTHGTPFSHGYTLHSAVPQASVFRGTDLPIGDSVESTVAGYSIRWDNAGMFDGDGLLIAPATGLYLCAGCIFWATNAVGQRVLHLVINNTVVIIDDHDSGGGSLRGMSAARPYRLAAGDNLRMRVLQQSGGTLNLAGSSGNSQFGMEMSMTWLSA